VDAAEPARAHEPDARRPADGERAADRRRAEAASDDRGREISRPDLRSVVAGGREALEVALVQADPDLPVDDSHGRRDRPRVPHPPFALDGDVESLA
jgi:hypothetical protein